MTIRFEYCSRLDRQWDPEKAGAFSCFSENLLLGHRECITPKKHKKSEIFILPILRKADTECGFFILSVLRKFAAHQIVAGSERQIPRRENAKLPEEFLKALRQQRVRRKLRISNLLCGSAQG